MAEGFLSTPPHCLQPPTQMLFLLVFLLNGWWSHHIWCVDLLSDIMDLHMSSLGTFVIEGPCCVFYATRYQVYWGLWDKWFFASTLIWYHWDTKSHTAHSGANRLTHPYKYILKPPIMWSQQLYLLHWMDNPLVLRIYVPQCLCWLVQIMYLLIRFKKLCSSHETQTILMEMV